MNKNLSAKKSFPIAGILFALYGVLMLGMDLYYNILSMVLYKESFTVLITGISYPMLLEGLIFIGLGIMLFTVSDNYVPALITGAIMFIYSIVSNLSDIVYEITSMIEDGDYFSNLKYALADIITLPVNTVFAVAFAVFALYILLAMIAKKKNKRSGILAMWFVPAAVIFLGGLVFFITNLIYDAIYQLDFLYIVAEVLYAVVYLVLAVAMLLYCMNINKENKQLATDAAEPVAAVENEYQTEILK